MMGQRITSQFLGDSMGDALPEHEAGVVLDALGQGLCVCDEQGRPLWANRVFRSYPEPFQQRVGGIARKAASARHASGAAVGEGLFATRLALPRVGRYFEVTVAPFGLAGSGGAEAAAQLAVLVRDITGQERLRRKILAIERAGRDLVHLEPETIKKMHVAERLRLLEGKVVRFAHDLLNFDHFTIRLLNQESRQLELVMSSGVSEKACSIKLYAEPTGNGISGLVAATGKAYICADTSKDPLYVYGMDQAGSSLTVPLKLFDRVVGIFNVESNTTNAFADNDRQFAEIFGHYIAMALHILNLLVVERFTTSQHATGTVQGELSGPLNDLVAEAEALKEQTGDPEVAKHIERMLGDVDAIRKRLKGVTQGTPTLLGADDALERSEVDPALRGRRILVVDNETQIRDTIREVLTLRGAEVTVCDDGASAEKLLLQWQLTHDADQGFDLVVSDINLGDKTGYDVFAAAKAASGSLPVILMTGFGYDPHHSIVRASQVGLQAVLFKPFQVEKLIEEVKKAIVKSG